MAKCYNCGKNFDYDKYYGICPACSAYNREKLPEEEHQELHEEYDQVKECGSLKADGHAPSEGKEDAYGYVPLEDKTDAYGYVPLERNPNPYRQGAPAGARPKASSATIVVFILLILGLVAAIFMPIFYLVGKSMELGVRVVQDAAEASSDWNGSNRAYLDDYEDEAALPEMDQPRQNAETVTAGIQDTCVFGKSEAMEVAVTGQPYVKAAAGQIGGFPASEKLVAIPVSYWDGSDPYDSYSGLGIAYVEYGDQVFKTILSSYEMEGYALDLEVSDVVDTYDMIGESGQGEFTVFVPEEVTEISLYMESRDEDTNQILGIYEIPLVIREEAEAGEGTGSGEAE